MAGFTYFIILFVVLGVAIIVTVISLCCCGPCGTRKPQETEGDVTEVVLYPETGQNGHPTQRHTYEGHHPYFDEPGADHDRYYTPAQNEDYHRHPHHHHHQHQRMLVRVGDQRPVTAVVANSHATRAEGPYVGTVVCAPTGVDGVRDPVSYGQAVYVSRSESDVVPSTKAHHKN